MGSFVTCPSPPPFHRFRAVGQVPLGKLVANAECNVMSHVKIGHHFMRLMMEKGLPGCVCFTGALLMRVCVCECVCVCVCE